jgi:hypothetical protein
MWLFADEAAKLTLEAVADAHGVDGQDQVVEHGVVPEIPNWTVLRNWGRIRMHLPP